jgi:hypothetical protein
MRKTFLFATLMATCLVSVTGCKKEETGNSQPNLNFDSVFSPAHRFQLAEDFTLADHSLSLTWWTELRMAV